MNIILAITAASGAIYARQLADELLACDKVERMAVIYSDHAREVMQHEGIVLPASHKIVEFDNRDLFASPASGSARWEAMVVVPSSVGTVARIAAGTAATLIERAADVMLKERRRLILVVRETPYSLIHLRNMTSLTEAGAIILPASPSFYALPQSIEQLCRSVTERVVSLLGLDRPHYVWQHEEKHHN